MALASIAQFSLMAVVAGLVVWPIAIPDGPRRLAQVDRTTESCAPGLGTVPGAVKTPPNILLIVLDDLGTQRLRFYQQSPTFAQTPRMTSLAGSGLVFTNAYTCPLCSPSRATIQTGRHPFHTGMGDLPENAPVYPLPGTEITIPKMLKASTQYACGVFGKWHLSTDGAHPVTSAGYDRFIGHIGNNSTDHYSWSEYDYDGTTMIRTAFQAPPFDESHYSASVVETAAAGWITQQTGPWFACVNFNPPHEPWQVPPLTTLSPASQLEVAGASTTAGAIFPNGHRLSFKAYDWMIESIDTLIDRLLNSIGWTPQSNTLVIIFGDNGSPGSIIDPNLFDQLHGKKTMYQLGVRVPMLVAGPGVTNGVCSAPIGAVDLFDTIATVAQATLSPTWPVRDGVDCSLLLGSPGAASPHPQQFAQLFSPKGPWVPSSLHLAPVHSHLRMITDGQYKYMYNYHLDANGNPVTDRQEAYDIIANPQELVTMNLWPPGGASGPAIIALQTQMTNLSGQ